MCGSVFVPTASHPLPISQVSVDFFLRTTLQAEGRPAAGGRSVRGQAEDCFETKSNDVGAVPPPSKDRCLGLNSSLSRISGTQSLSRPHNLAQEIFGKPAASLPKPQRLMTFRFEQTKRRNSERSKHAMQRCAGPISDSAAFAFRPSVGMVPRFWSSVQLLSFSTWSCSCYSHDTRHQEH